MAHASANSPRRARAAACVAAVLLVVGATAAVPKWERPPLATPTGAMHLNPGDQAMTDWVEVTAGNQLTWRLEPDAFIAYEVQADGMGLLDGGDGGSMHGCARADAPFRARMWWGNVALFNNPGPANVNYSLTVEPAGPDACRPAPQVVQSSGVFSNAGSRDEPPLAIWVLPGVTGNLAFGALVALQRRR